MSAFRDFWSGLHTARQQGLNVTASGLLGLACGAVRGPCDRLFIVPAFMGNRNTKRYRTNHLAEICGQFTTVEIIDFRDPPESFFKRLANERCIVVLQRLSTENPLSRDFLDRVRASACPVLYDIDDLLFEEANIEGWRLASWDIKPDNYREAMAYAHSFIAATPPLAAALSETFGKPADVLPNVLNDEIMSRSQAAAANTQRADKPFIIGYASGSASHDADLDEALEDVARFLAHHEDARFHTIGEVALPEAFRQRAGLQLVEIAKVPWFDLPAVLASFDVQIIPLAPCAFNACKSHIRYLESAAVGVPVLASRVGQQAQSIRDGETGILTESAETDWFDGLARLYADPALRKQLAAQSLADIQSRYTTQSTHQVKQARAILLRAAAFKAD